MKPIVVEMHIKAPIEQVFDAMTDLESAPERVEAIQKIELLTEGPVGKGTRFRETRIMFKREATEEMTITEFDPPKSYQVEAESCGAHYTTVYTFHSEGDGTRVQCSFGAEPMTFFAKLMSPLSKLMAGTLRKCLTGDMESIAKHLEGRAEPEAPEGTAEGSPATS